MTKQERRIAALDREIVIEELKVRAGAAVGNEAESFFRAYAEAKGCRVLRAGWPDFLLDDPKTGKAFGVEVKSDIDAISTPQVRCFALLERLGVPVYIWSPSTPGRLKPWRRYLQETKRVRLANGGVRRLRQSDFV